MCCYLNCYQSKFDFKIFFTSIQYNKTYSKLLSNQDPRMSRNNDNANNFGNNDDPRSPPGGNAGNGGGPSFTFNAPNNDLPQLLDSRGSSCYSCPFTRCRRFSRLKR